MISSSSQPHNWAVHCIKFILLTLSCLLILGGLIGCTKQNSLNDNRLRITSTTTIIGNIVDVLAGDLVNHTTLMHAGVDPHLYKPSAQDIQSLSTANIIFYNGLNLEGRMQDVFQDLRKREIPTYAATENIPNDQLIFPSKAAGHPDPHVWFDPQLWTLCVDLIESVLTKNLPEHTQLIKERAIQYRKMLIDTESWGHKRIDSLPENKRILITSHDAYNYFGRRFHVQVIGVQGISTTTEAGLADIAQTVDFIKKHNVKAIFIESSVSPATIERISKDAHIKLGGELFSDALGQAGKIEKGPDGESYDIGTWEGMMKHNINTIVEALK
jgi:manganese/zinc/iron transport system substrate-binding protein